MAVRYNLWCCVFLLTFIEHSHQSPLNKLICGCLNPHTTHEEQYNPQRPDTNYGYPYPYPAPYPERVNMCGPPVIPYPSQPTVINSRWPQQPLFEEENNSRKASKNTNTNVNINTNHNHVDSGITHIIAKPPSVLQTIALIVQQLQATGNIPVVSPENTQVIIMRIDELISYMTNLQGIPDHLKQFLLETPIDILRPILLELSKRMPNIPYNAIMDYILSLKANRTREIQQEKIKMTLTEFIVGLIRHNTLSNIHPNTLQLILEYPDLANLITTIFQENNLPISGFTPKLIMELLQLMYKINQNEPIQYISPQLLLLVLNLKNGQKISEAFLTIQLNSGMDAMQLILQLVYNNGGTIPENLHMWISTLPDAPKIFELLERPGDIKCTTQANGKMHCEKGDSPAMIAELETLINGFINNELTEMSPELMQFIINHPNLHELILQIFTKNNIPFTKVNPGIIEQLIQLIIKYKTNDTIQDIPLELIKFLITLRGAGDLSTVVFNWVEQNRYGDMIQLFLQIVKDNGGKIIPEYLRNWLLTLSNGKEIIDYLLKPGEIKCRQQDDDTIYCEKTIVDNLTIRQPQSSGGLSSSIKAELHRLIVGLNNNELNDMSPSLLQFISTYSNLQELMIKLFQENNIALGKLNPGIVEQLLKLIVKFKNNATIQEIPANLINLVANLRGGGAASLSQTVFSWIERNRSADMMQLFLQVIKENGGTIIPVNLRSWLLTIPNGPQILEFLEKPGEITCKEQGNGTIACTKLVYPG